MYTLDFTDFGLPVCLIAALLYLIRNNKLNSLEKPIAVVIWLNLICDLLAFFLSEYEIETGIIYNLLLPAERTISLVVYASVARTAATRRLFQGGIASIFLIRILATKFESSLTDFQYVANTVEGLLVAILSYVFIRTALTANEKFSLVIFAFAIANFLYLTLMASAMSAIPLASTFDLDYSNALLGLNTLAYVFWSLTLIIALLWKNR